MHCATEKRARGQFGKVVRTRRNQQIPLRTYFLVHKASLISGSDASNSHSSMTMLSLLNASSILPVRPGLWMDSDPVVTSLSLRLVQESNLRGRPRRAQLQ